MKNIILLMFLFVLSSQSLRAQLTPGSKVYREIVKADSLLFKEGFNNCNFEILKKITAEDLEFYHDQGGITFGKEAFIETTRKNICSISYKPIRKLVEGSLQIYPLKNNGKIYGALQIGLHEFYAQEKDKAPYLTSVAKFTHLWIKQEDSWLLKRVLSYDHRSPKE